MVLQLLALGGLGAKQRPAGVEQVRPLVVELLVDEEVLLLRAHGGHHPLGLVIPEQPQQPQGLLGQRLHRAEQRRLLVQHFPAVGAEGRGDVEGIPLDEGVGGGVPGGVAPGLEGGPQPAGGEGGGVRFPLNELFARKLHDDPAVGGGGDEAVVLLRGDAV